MALGRYQRLGMSEDAGNITPATESCQESLQSSIISLTQEPTDFGNYTFHDIL